MIYRVDSAWESKIAKVPESAFGDLYAYSKVEIKNNNLPTWGIVQFSISYPIPEGIYSGDGAEGLWPKPESENIFDGRYRGITRFKTAGSQNESFSSRVFYLSQEGRFSSSIAASLGESEDSSQNIISSAFRWIAPVATGSHSIESLAPDEGNVLHQENRFRFSFKPSGDNLITGAVELGSFEILQYEDSINKNNFHRFLVLHFVAINCESETIDGISQSLLRQRNILDCDSREEVSILEEVAKFINRQLSTEGKKYDFAFAKGGYLASKTSNSTSDLKRSNLLAPPMRTVCAIPNIDASRINHIPKSFQPHLAVSSDEHIDGAHLLWGSQMVNGYDIFPQEMPTPQSVISSSRNEMSHANWDFVIDHGGVASIRKLSSLVRDMNIAMLSPTRYIDILILLQRTYTSLRFIGEELRDIERVEHKSFGDVSLYDMHQLQEYRASLLKPVNQLLKVQNDFAEIRKTLWFNAIPKRTLDTFLMLQLREEMGVEGLYNDLVDEVQYRQQIYNLTYHEHDSYLKSLEAELARKDRDERSKQLKEEENRNREAQERQAERDRNFNFIISVIAIGLAVPSYVALVVEDGVGKHGWLLLFIGLAISVLISSAILGARKWYNRKK